MKNNHGFSNILVISIALLLIGVGGYFGGAFFYKKFKNPAIQTVPNSFSCDNVKQVVSLFSENFKDTVFDTKMVNPDISEDIKIRVATDKPIQIYQAEAVSYADNIDEKLWPNIVPTFKDKIESKILSLGFTKEFTFNRPLDSWDYYQYKSGDIKLVIELPTDRKGEFPNQGFRISCGKIDKNDQKQIEKLSNFYSKDTSIQVSDNKDNVLIVNIYDEKALGGGFRTYDISKDKPELIYDGSESINCSILQTRKIGKGIRCVNSNKEYTENQ